ncbi:MAG: hypothetical protein GX108_06965 [Thermovirga sp.]|jgi:hypothetical protein|nr:hypothetical protein [Thermovirga sp.]
MAEMGNHWLSVDETGKYPGTNSDVPYRWVDKRAMPGHRRGTYEITRTLPRELKGQLSQPEEIAALLEGIDE